MKGGSIPTQIIIIEIIICEDSFRLFVDSCSDALFLFLPFQDLHKGVEIQAANGRKMLALKVFSHALRFFKDHCLQELSDQSSTRIVNDDIRWVITVPAIWRQPAKQFMRQASYEVNISLACNSHG